MERLCLEDQPVTEERRSGGPSRRNPQTLRPVVGALIDQAENRAAAGDFEQADSLFRAAVAADVTATARIAYGIHLFEQDQEEAAEIQLREGWDAARRNGCRIGRAIACSNLALLYLERGDLILAKQFEQQALAAWFEEQPEETAADSDTSDSGASRYLPTWLRRLVATGWFAIGEEEAAARLLTSDRTDSPESAEEWFDAGVLAEQQGQIANALKALDRSLEAARRCDDTFGEAACLERLAALWRKSGHWRRADRALQAAEEIHVRCRRFRARHRCQSARTRLAAPLLMMNTDPGLN